MTKPQKNTFSKYCKDNAKKKKKLDRKYTYTVQGLYNKQKKKKLSHIL
jgi:hypothetical protein